MSKLLKGNFDLKNNIDAPEVDENASDKLEREAISSLGGSIAFVSKKKVLWDGEADGNSDADK